MIMTCPAGFALFSLPRPVLVACPDVRPCRVLAGRGCGLIGARCRLIDACPPRSGLIIS